LYLETKFEEGKNIEKEITKEETLGKIEQSMRERRVFKYGYMHILHYIF